MAPIIQTNLERFSTYWYPPSCCVWLDFCAAEFGSSGETYELSCIRLFYFNIIQAQTAINTDAPLNYTHTLIILCISGTVVKIVKSEQSSFLQFPAQKVKHCDTYIKWGARGSVLGWGTMLQAGR
jgi:hypothetical protein